jgi:uncharacterized phage protein (TIGR01671 family)
MENRVIKFRVWDCLNKEWCNFPVSWPVTMSFKSKDLKFSQFTGLFDSKGNEIWEGDIIRCHYFYQALGDGLGIYEAEKEIIGKIYFRELGLWIECDDKDDSGYLLWINELHEESFEVIGNIYENPELLNDGTD